MKSVFIVTDASEKILGVFPSMAAAKDSVSYSCSKIGVTFTDTHFESSNYVDGNGAKGSIREHAVHDRIQHV